MTEQEPAERAQLGEPRTPPPLAENATVPPGVDRTPVPVSVTLATQTVATPTLAEPHSTAVPVGRSPTLAVLVPLLGECTVSPL